MGTGIGLRQVGYVDCAGGGQVVIVDGIAYAGSFSHRIIGVDVHSGRTVLRFPHGDYVPVSGNGMRLLLNGFSRIYAVEPRHSHRRRLAR